MFEIADLVIDNCAPEGDAALDLAGSPHRIGPTTTIAGAAINNTIVIEAAAELQKLGLSVPIFPSASGESGSEDHLESVLATWSPKVRLFASHKIDL